MEKGEKWEEEEDKEVGGRRRRTKGEEEEEKEEEKEEDQKKKNSITVSPIIPSATSELQSIPSNNLYLLQMSNSHTTVSYH